MGRYQSGQMGQTVNLLASPSGVQIPPGPPFHARIAQLAERIHGKDEVSGANPLPGSSFKKKRFIGLVGKFIDNLVV